MRASQVWAGQPGFFGAVCAVPLLLASCASPGQQAIATAGGKAAWVPLWLEPLPRPTPGAH